MSLEALFACIVLALQALHASASLIDCVLPQPAMGSKWVGLRNVIALFALNVGNARNAVPPGSLSASILNAIGGISKLGKVEPPAAATAMTAEQLDALTPEKFSKLISELPPLPACTASPAAAAPVLDLAPFAISDVMPATKTAIASDPAATGTVFTARTPTMSLWSEIKTFFVDAFDAAEQASIAETVSTDIAAAAGKAGQAVGLLGAVVTGAAATGVISGDVVHGAQTALTKVSSTIGALSAVTPTSTFTGVLSEFKAVADVLPMGGNDRKNADAIITGLAAWLPTAEVIGGAVAAAI